MTSGQDVRCQLRGGLDRSTQHPIAKLEDEAGLLGHRQELCRAREPPVGHSPADQCLDQTDPQAVQAHFRLEKQLELLVLERPPDPLLGGELAGGGLEELAREQRCLVAAERLGAKQRRIGSAQQGLGRMLVVRVEARSDAHAHGDAAPLDAERPFESADDAMSGQERRLRRIDLLVHDREFIAPQARGETESLGGLLQALSDADEHAVAEGVAHAVVEILEVVEIDEEYGDAAAARARPLDRAVQEDEELAPVRKQRERVMLRQMLQQPGALLDLSLERAPVTLRDFARRAQLGRHAVEGDGQGVQLLQAAARSAHIFTAREPAGRLDQPAHRNQDAAHRPDRDREPDQKDRRRDPGNHHPPIGGPARWWWSWWSW